MEQVYDTAFVGGEDAAHALAGLEFLKVVGGEAVEQVNRVVAGTRPAFRSGSCRKAAASVRRRDVRVGGAAVVVTVVLP